MNRALLTPVRRLLERVQRRVARLQDLHESVIEIHPSGTSRGVVLLSYIIDPFLLAPGAGMSNAHTHHWESWRIAQSFLDRGYSVDVVSYRNAWYRPNKDYVAFIGARTNFQRLAQAMPSHCRKVVHLDTAHWLFNNHAAYGRLLDVQRRRGVTLNNAKMVEVNFAIESADCGTVLGNDFTMETYRYAAKPLHRIPISVPATYPYPEDRDLGQARRHFLWFGSSGFVHKGLDRVLEAFVGMPDLHLHVCGPFDDEPEFLRAFERELFHTSNIHPEGWIDVSSTRFTDLCRRSIGIVYPSASEGGGGSVISCMHAGLIPLVSRQASVDIGSFGTDLGDSSVVAIRDAVRQLVELGDEELERRARASWQHVRMNHTRERFSAAMGDFIDGVLPS